MKKNKVILSISLVVVLLFVGCFVNSMIFFSLFVESLKSIFIVESIIVSSVDLNVLELL